MMTMRDQYDDLIEVETYSTIASVVFTETTDCGNHASMDLDEAGLEELIGILQNARLILLGEATE